MSLYYLICKRFEIFRFIFISFCLSLSGNTSWCAVDLCYPVRFCYLPLKQWVVLFDNEKCNLLNCFINVYTYHNPTPTLTVMHSNYVLYPLLWIEGIHLVPVTNNKYFFYLLDCVLLTSTPTPTLNLPLQ